MPPSTHRQQRTPSATGRDPEPEQAADGEDRGSAPPAGGAPQPNPGRRPVGPDAEREGGGVEVAILGRTFRIACAPEEETQVREAVDYLDAKMREIRDSGKVVGHERIAIMAALNITHELLTLRLSD